MRWRPSARGVLAFAALALAASATVLAQRGRWMPPEENEVPLPPDAEDPAEYTFARLVYNSGREGWRGGQPWQVDSPAAERHFVQGVRRLTGIHARPKERYVTLLDDELFDYPWLYAVEVGQWTLSEEEAARLREYLLRGGFLMCDDFHGSYEWMSFVEGMSQVFPDRPIVEVPDHDPVFHVFYNVDRKVQVPGIQYLRSGRTFERDGVDPHWRGIYDDKGRLMVIINFNMDLGDAWEWADLPEYPENWTALAYRFGINYLVYAMTH
jgi:hypothetical protein